MNEDVLLGQIQVDSGRIAIVDSYFIDKVAIQEAKKCEIMNLGVQLEVLGTGVYDVYGQYDETGTKIKSIRIDFKSDEINEYTCGCCGAVNDADAWNDETRKEFDSIDEIQTRISVDDNCYYVCPSCKATMQMENITKVE